MFRLRFNFNIFKWSEFAVVPSFLIELISVNYISMTNHRSSTSKNIHGVRKLISVDSLHLILRLNKISLNVRKLWESAFNNHKSIEKCQAQHTPRLPLKPHQYKDFLDHWNSTTWTEFHRFGETSGIQIIGNVLLSLKFTAPLGGLSEKWRTYVDHSLVCFFIRFFCLCIVKANKPTESITATSTNWQTTFLLFEQFF